MLKYLFTHLSRQEVLHGKLLFLNELTKKSLSRFNRRFSVSKRILYTSNMEGCTAKISSDEFQSILTSEIKTIHSAFINEGFELRIVGGAVRDLLLGIKPEDIDLSTNATPDEMIEILSKNQIRCIETGLKHGTITAHINKLNFEVTTLRVDVETDGRHAKVQFTNDWKLDAERRDLTINAMSIELDGTLFDYFNGQKDLLEHRIRFVGNAKARIQEDYLRILRYFRFYGRIAKSPDQHDEDTLMMIKETADGLKIIAVERIWVELAKILVGNHAPTLLQHMYNLDVARYIGLPEYSEKRLTEFSRAWKEGKTHNLQPVTLLCTLVETSNQAEQLCRDLKLSNAERNLARFIAEHRNTEKHDLKHYQDILVSCPSNAVDNMKTNVIELLHYEGCHDIADEISMWNVPQFPLTGNDLKKHGLKPGPELGRTLAALKTIWKETYYVANKQDLLDRIKNIVK